MWFPLSPLQSVQGVHPEEWIIDVSELSIKTSSHLVMKREGEILKIMGRAPLYLISFPLNQKIYLSGFILEGIQLLNIYPWRQSTKFQFRDLIRHSLLVFDLQ